MPESKRHYKMYKAGKKWMFAALGTLSILGAGATAHADEIAGSTTASDPSSAQVATADSSNTNTDTTNNSSNTQDAAQSDSQSQTDSSQTTNDQTDSQTAAQNNNNNAVEMEATPANTQVQTDQTDKQTAAPVDNQIKTEQANQSNSDQADKQTAAQNNNNAVKTEKTETTPADNQTAVQSSKAQPARAASYQLAVQPAANTSADNTPATSQPAANTSADNTPATSQPAANTSADSTPATSQPTTNTSADSTPASASQTTSQSSASVQTQQPTTTKAPEYGATAIKEAQKYLGQPYVWGGSNPSTGFDCSGLVQWSYAKAGVDLPRTSQEQWGAVTPISASEAKAGDLVFFSGTYDAPGMTHVGIYLGNGKMLDAQNNGVVVDNISDWPYQAYYGRIKAAYLPDGEASDDDYVPVEVPAITQTPTHNIVTIPAYNNDQQPQTFTFTRPADPAPNPSDDATLSKSIFEAKLQEEAASDASDTNNDATAKEVTPMTASVAAEDAAKALDLKSEDTVDTTPAASQSTDNTKTQSETQTTSDKNNSNSDSSNNNVTNSDVTSPITTASAAEVVTPANNITVASNSDDAAHTLAYSNDSKVTVDPNSQYSYTDVANNSTDVLNNISGQSNALPQTGESDNPLLDVIGLSLVVLSGSVYLYNRRKFSK